LGVWRQSDIDTGSEERVLGVRLDNRGRHLMPRDSRKRNQRVFPAEGIQIASAQTDPPDFQQHAALDSGWFWNRHNLRLAWFADHERFHVSLNPSEACAAGFIAPRGSSFSPRPWPSGM
jgi:hypothetical protein